MKQALIAIGSETPARIRSPLTFFWVQGGASVRIPETGQKREGSSCLGVEEAGLTRSPSLSVGGCLLPASHDRKGSPGHVAIEPRTFPSLPRLSPALPTRWELKQRVLPRRALNRAECVHSLLPSLLAGALARTAFCAWTTSGGREGSRAAHLVTCF